jgi:hypothetical protein
LLDPTRASCQRTSSVFKAQLLEYVDELEQPFDMWFLIVIYTSFIEDVWVRNIYGSWRKKERPYDSTPTPYQPES